jgi:hypothetical protein
MVKNPAILLDAPFLEEEEIWLQTTPKMGDHIRVSRGLYNHHGIYVSEQEVIHFTGDEDDSILDWSKNEVICTNLDRFLLNGVLECKEYTDDEFEDLYPVNHIISYARACLGDRGYNLLFNNCEHFANVCTLGRFRSHQVERIFSSVPLKIPTGSRREMGLFSWISNIFGGKSSGGGGRSTTSTTYEPDKVKLAEIEQETNVKLANMEMKKIELMKNARIEVLEKEHYLKEALLEANARGLSYVAQTIVAIQSKLDEVTQKRLEIIEKGSLGIVKEIEGFYAELGAKITKDNDEYNLNKLPLLLETLGKFEEGSAAFKLYEKRIDEDKAMHLRSIERQFDNLSKRQDQIIEGFLKSKEKIMEQTSQITAGLLEHMVKPILEGSVPSHELLENSSKEKHQALTGSSKRYLLD